MPHTRLHLATTTQMCIVVDGGLYVFIATRTRMAAATIAARTGHSPESVTMFWAGMILFEKSKKVILNLYFQFTPTLPPL